MLDHAPAAAEPVRRHSFITLEPAYLSAAAAADSPPDAAAPNLFRGRLVTAGQVRDAANQPGRLFIQPEAIIDAIERGLFEGLACFIDHTVQRGGGSLRDLFGTWHDVVWNEQTQSADGLLTRYANSETEPIAQRLAQIVEAAGSGDPVPDIGVSIVFHPRFHPDSPTAGPLSVAQFNALKSADLVFSPAADGRILQALSALVHPGESSIMSNNVKPEKTKSGAGSQPAPDPAKSLPPEMLDAVRQTAAVTAAEVAGATAAEVAGDTAAEVAGVTAIEIAGAAVDSRIASLIEEAVVQLEGSPPRISGMRHASQDVHLAVDWLFGAPDASLPEPRLRSSAELYRLLTGDVHWRGVFEPAEALATASVTTLADLAVNAMNKVIVATWDTLAAYRWYELVVSVQPNDGSLQNMAWIQFGGIADLPAVAEGAAYTEATVVDSKESDAFSKYGVYVGITRKMLRNSEIGRIQAIPRALAVSAVRTRESKIAGIFTSNSGVGPTLDNDSIALFNASHSNLATTTFSYAAWSAARQECYKQTEAGSAKRLGFWPKYWLGPAELYDSALEIFGYGAGPGGKPGTADNEVNPFAQTRPGDPRPIPLAVPSFTDANDWAYLADPAIQPIIQVSYAQNPGGGAHPLPELFSVVNETAGLMFTNDTMPIKVRDEFAYGVSGYRGIGKRNVS